MNLTASDIAATLILISLPLMLSAQPSGAEDDTLLQALTQLSALEESRSNTDLQLAEPLLQLAEEYRQRGRFADAHAALDRGMQIVQINSGLYTPEQLPYLEKKIENFADWLDWDSARELLEHLMWLHRTKTRLIDEELLENLMQVSRYHLRGISQDSLEYQTYHFRRALSSNWLAVSAAERLWSTTDKRLVPMLYSLIKQYHLQAVAIDRGGRTGYELRQIVPGTDWVRERSEMRMYYYDMGQRILSQLDGIYETADTADQEGLAMIHLYRADWQMMFSRDEEALESYQLAFEGLSAAGNPTELINQFFSSPTLLPENEFHDTLNKAVTSRSARPSMASISDQQLESTLYFAEWSASFPYVRSPYRQQDSGNVDSGFALFSLSLSGMTEMTRWLSPRSVLEFGELLDATLLKPSGTELGNQQELRQRLEWLHFRPRMVDGHPEETSATLLYQPAPRPRLVGL